MKISTVPKVYVGFGAAALVLSLIGAVSYRSTVRAEETAHWVAHTHEVLTSVEGLVAALADAQNAVRGYVITGNESHLESYRDAVGSVRREYRQLRGLTADNDSQQRRLDALGPLIDARFHALEEVRRLRAGPEFDIVPYELLVDRGKRTMDDVRAVVGEMRREEEGLLRVREQEARDSSRATAWFIALGGLVGLAVVVLAVAVVHRDLVLQRRTEAHLGRALEAAEAASRAEGEFLANMSHEIRTPLNGILGMTQLALDTDLTPDQRHCLEIVSGSAQALLGVVNDILDFAKIEARKLELDEVGFSLRECVGDAVKLFGPRADAKGLELVGRVGPDVPDALMGDAGRLRQVLTNLVGNAIKFTERGEVVVEVEGGEQRTEDIGRRGQRTEDRGQRTEKPGSSLSSVLCPLSSSSDVLLHFAVRDTGVGIPAEKQRLVFEAFAQADASTARRFGGTGLGLAICSELVALMGGRIWLESAPGGGSTFHFTARFWLGSAEGPPARAVDLEGLPVLVVDGSATSGRAIGEMLSNWHLRPTGVADVGAALAELGRAAAAGEPFPLVLLDARLFGEGGPPAELVAQSHGRGGALVLMLPPAGRGDAADRYCESPVAACVRKPVKQSDLLDAILTALGRLPAPAAGPAAPAAAGPRGLRVLLAEDNEVNQELAVRLLGRQGHTVVVAGNGREAVAAWEAGAFDFILMDVQMPEMDGLVATAEIRTRERHRGGHVPVIALTAHAMKGDRERCLAAGMDEYVSKPIRLPELLRAIERVVPAFTAPAEMPAAAPADGEGGAFDARAALARVDGDKGLLRKLTDLFSDNAPKLLAAAREAVARQDGTALGRAAHQIQSTATIFGARAVTETAQRLEGAGRQGDYAGAGELVGRLETEVAAVLRGLAGINRSDGPPAQPNVSSTSSPGGSAKSPPSS